MNNTRSLDLSTNESQCTAECQASASLRKSAGPASSLAHIPVFVSNPWESWASWTPHHQATLNPGGTVDLGQNTGNAGIISDLIPLKAGGLYRVSVVLATQSDPRSVRLSILLSDSRDEWMGPWQRQLPGASECFFFVPHRIRAVKLSLVAHAPKIGSCFSLESIALDRIDSESFYLREKHNRQTPVIASMASIPSRHEMLRDAVDSLLLQCDIVRVFLNGYPDVPSFLDHPRAQIRRSQDWDDRGDVGKFGWIDVVEQPGYRVIADDDLLYPPNFVRGMIKVLERHENRAVAALHGILLKHPVTNYYDANVRTVIYFASKLGKERTVHILGTNALIYHSECVTMHCDDFMFRNMADIFLARYAQRNRIPMICVERPRCWVRQNLQQSGFETIYEGSRNRDRSNFDTSLAQDYLVRHMVPLTIQPTLRPKLALCLAATNIAATEKFLEAWEGSRSPDTDWLLIVAAATDDPALSEFVASIKSATELHIVPAVEMTASQRVVRMLTLAIELRVSLVCITLDCVRFVSDEWTRQPVDSILRGPWPGIYGRIESDSIRFESDIKMDGVLPVVAILNAQLLTPELLSGHNGNNVAATLRTILVGSGVA